MEAAQAITPVQPAGGGRDRRWPNDGRPARKPWPEEPRGPGRVVVMPEIPGRGEIEVVRRGGRPVPYWISPKDQRNVQGWQAMGCKPVQRPPGTKSPGVEALYERARSEGRMCWTEGRCAWWIVLWPWIAGSLEPGVRERIGLDDYVDRERTGTPVPEYAPVSAWQHFQASATHRGKAVVQVGEEVSVQWPGRNKDRGKDGAELVAGVDWWLLLAGVPANEAARAAGWRWMESLGVWGTPRLMAAAALAGLADPQVKMDLEAHGIPIELQRQLLHAPALVPWEGKQWILIAQNTWSQGYEHPGQPWRRRPEGIGWGTRQSSCAWEFVRFAPRKLAEALADAAEAGILRQVTPAKRSWLEDTDQKEGLGDAAFGGERDPPEVVWCSRCSEVVVRGRTALSAREDEGAKVCTAGMRCRGREESDEAQAVIVKGASLERLGRNRAKADRRSWREVSAKLGALEMAERNAGKEVKLDLTGLHEVVPSGEKLYPLQEEAVRFALAQQVALDGTVMGGGKTINAMVVINALERHREKGNARTAVAVVPAFLRENWLAEAGRWLDPDIPATVVRGQDANIPARGLVIASYETVRDHRTLRRRKHRLVIADEAHFLKNPQARRTRAVLGLKADRWLMLTGTPIYNRPKDVQVFLAMAAPEAYGNRAGFERAYRLERPDAPSDDEQQMLEGLADTLRGSILFRPPKHRVLEGLPPKRPPALIPVHLGADTEAIAAQERALLRQLRDTPGRSTAIFAQLNVLRQGIAQRKIPAVVELMAMLAGDESPHLTFTWHREIADRIAEGARAKGLKVGVIHGGYSDRERHAAKVEFQDKEALDALVLNMAAGGVGLNLTRAQAVVMAEIDWSPANMAQAEARAYRKGQTRSVRTYYVMAQGTIDADLAHAAAGKEQSAATALGDGVPEEILQKLGLLNAENTISGTP